MTQADPLNPGLPVCSARQRKRGIQAICWCDEQSNFTNFQIRTYLMGRLDLRYTFPRYTNLQIFKSEPICGEAQVNDQFWCRKDLDNPPSVSRRFAAHIRLYIQCPHIWQKSQAAWVRALQYRLQLHSPSQSCRLF